MGTSILVLALTIGSGLGQEPTALQVGAIQDKERNYQNEVFQRWFEADLVWRFDSLPTEGAVPGFRVPYSGHDYPDEAGGTVDVLRKYDAAFHDGQPLAAEFEHEDVTAFSEPTVERRGLFGLRRVVVDRPPHWHGHCNGWTAAAIRHAEPQESVIRNGVTFRPSDIKGLLAEIYMYRDNEFLGGIDDAMNPGTLHTVLANWIGRGDHPVGIETAVGEEVWNYPLYAFKTASRKRSDGSVEVKMNAAYSQSTRREFNRSRHLMRTIYFHYRLTLDEEGAITGGTYFPDSARIDFLWAALHPVPGGEPGNERGNPHIDVNEVLAIWRESVPEALRMKWYNIDPTEEDRILEEGEEAREGGAAGEEVVREEVVTAEH